MKPRSVIGFFAVVFLGQLTAYASGSDSAVKDNHRELTFVPLNPARGDAAPQAGVLWGNIRANVWSGAIIKFRDGFQSPPHIHNVTYRGVVIDGQVHNDDPVAAKQWLGPGAYWSQVAGEAHITAAKPGASATVFLEILSGPYLVKPTDDAFDTGEQSVNVAYDNLVWVTASGSLADSNARSARTYLWQQGAHSGSLLRLAAGASVSVQADAPLRLVGIRGELSVRAAAQPAKPLHRARYQQLPAADIHDLQCHGATVCLSYISALGTYRFVPDTQTQREDSNPLATSN
ncbi:MAG: DUF4437 domain-containing protein [Pseudomonadota bacterium]